MTVNLWTWVVFGLEAETEDCCRRCPGLPASSDLCWLAGSGRVTGRGGEGQVQAGGHHAFKMVHKGQTCFHKRPGLPYLHRWQGDGSVTVVLQVVVGYSVLNKNLL